MPDRDDHLGLQGLLLGHGRRFVGLRLQAGDLTRIPGPDEREAVTHLIAGFPFGMTPDGWTCGTVVWFAGNTRGERGTGGVELGPHQLGTAPRGFWTRLTDDLKRAARIDRQKYIVRDGHRFCVYHVQIGAASIACVMVRVDFDVGVRAMRYALNLSLDHIKNVWVDPTDGRHGYFRIES